MPISPKLQARIDAADAKFEQMLKDDPILRMIHEANSKGRLYTCLKLQAEMAKLSARLNVEKTENAR